MVKTKQITENSKELEIFLDICNEKGYTNNSNLNKLKFNGAWIQGGSWWVTEKDNKIIAISGAHPLWTDIECCTEAPQIEPGPT